MISGNGGSASDTQRAARAMLRSVSVPVAGSRNVLAALQAARARGLEMIALTGDDGGPIGEAAEIHMNVPSKATAPIQEVHRPLLHVICDLVERALTD